MNYKSIQYSQKNLKFPTGGNIWIHLVHPTQIGVVSSCFFWFLRSSFSCVSIWKMSSACFLRRWDLGRGNFLECGVCANLKAEGRDCWMPFLEDVSCWKKRQMMSRGRGSHDEIFWIGRFKTKKSMRHTPRRLQDRVYAILTVEGCIFTHGLCSLETSKALWGSNGIHHHSR